MKLSENEILAIKAIFAAKERDDKASAEMQTGAENQASRDRRQGVGMAFALEWYQSRAAVLSILQRLMSEQS